MAFARPARLGPAESTLIGILRPRPCPPGLAGPASRNWPTLHALARHHGVHPLLAHRALEDEPFRRELSPDVIESCRDVVRKATTMNLMVDAELERIAAALSGQGIRSVLLKGASLARTVYPHPGIRVSRDLDILVAPEHTDAATETLRDLGFAPLVGEDEVLHSAEHHFHHPYVKNRLVVELHWGLVRPESPYGLPARGVMDRSLGQDAPGDVLHEALEDQVLHASGQFLSERCVGLLRICDLDVVLRRRGDDLDWEGLAWRAREGRLAPTVALLLRITREVLETAVPAGARHLDGLSGPARRAVEALQPSAATVRGAWVRRAGHSQLLRFWLLPGARTRVVHQFLFGHPRDRAHPSHRRLSLPVRATLVARRGLLLMVLFARQLLAVAAGRRDRLELTCPPSGTPPRRPAEPGSPEAADAPDGNRTASDAAPAPGP